MPVVTKLSLIIQVCCIVLNILVGYRQWKIEKMRKICDDVPWKEWFAWYPVTIHSGTEGTKRYWLRKVYRYGQCKSELQFALTISLFPQRWLWSYRATILDLMNDPLPPMEEDWWRLPLPKIPPASSVVPVQVNVKVK